MRVRAIDFNWNVPQSKKWQMSKLKCHFGLLLYTFCFHFGGRMLTLGKSERMIKLSAVLIGNMSRFLSPSLGEKRLLRFLKHSEEMQCSFSFLYLTFCLLTCHAVPWLVTKTEAPSFVFFCFVLFFFSHHYKYNSSTDKELVVNPTLRRKTPCKTCL